MSANAKITIEHVPTGHTLEFGSVIVKKFQSSINSNIQSNPVFGRTDPIYQFQGNARTIDCDFLMYENSSLSFNLFYMVDILNQFLYPKYTADMVLQAPPLLKITFGSLLGTPQYGYLKGFNYVYESPDKLENSPFTTGSAQPNFYTQGTIKVEPKISSPRYINISLNLSVIHMDTVGFGPDKSPLGVVLGPGKPAMGAISLRNNSRK